MAAIKGEKGMIWLCDWCFDELPVHPFKSTWINGVKSYHDPECWDASGDPNSTPPDPPAWLQERLAKRLIDGADHGE
jgi:hypothetical protein